MNEEYLWNKSGDDPEIRHMENTLAAFRYRETGPPPLPLRKPLSQSSSAEVEKPAWKFSFAFACLAAAAVIAVFSLRFVILPVSHTDQSPAAQFTPAAVKMDTLAMPPPAPAIHSEPDKIATSLDRIRPIYSGRAIYRTKRQHRPAPAKATAKQGLTKEEKHAYRQLLLALAVTSSTLKTVSDSVRGVEPAQISPNENNR